MRSTPQPASNPDLAGFWLANADVDLLSFDFHDAAAVGGLIWPHGVPVERSLAALKAYQRVLRIAPDAVAADALLAEGLDCAAKVASLPEDEFVARTADAFEDGATGARATHRKAALIKGQALHLWANVRGAVAAPHARALSADNLGEEIDDFFAALPSYEELFGPQDFCECEHCKSIFGPAAYFVDIMRIADRYVTQPNVATIAPTATLESRRKKLFELPLDCANTNDPVPYLQIVNEVLEDRARVELKVEDVCKALAVADYPFSSPVNVRLLEIRLYMGTLGVSLADVFSEYSRDPSSLEEPTARELLGLSVEQYRLAITPTPDEPALQRLYGLAGASLTTLDSEPAFRRHTGLTRDGLAALLEQGLSPAERAAGLPHGFYFNRQLPAGEYVFVETPADGTPRLHHLTLQTLDRINRFVRLSQWSGITFADLDWLLAALGAQELDDSSIRALAQARRAIAACGLAADVAAAFWHDMKTVGVGEHGAPQDLFDRVYNAPSLLAGGAPYHPTYALNPLYTDPIASWAVGGAEPVSTTFGRTRLMAALGVGDVALTQIGAAIFGHAENVELDVANLSKLYRFKLALDAFGVSISELVVVLGVVDLKPGEPIAPAKLLELHALMSWLRDNDIGVEALHYILTREQTSRLARAPVGRGEMTTLWQLVLPALAVPRSFTSETIPQERSEAAFDALLHAPSATAVIRSVRAAYGKVFGRAPATDVAIVLRPVEATEIAFLEEQGFSAAEVTVIATLLSDVYEAQSTLLAGQLALILGTTADVVEGIGAYVAAHTPLPPLIELLLTPVPAKEAGWGEVVAALRRLAWATFSARVLAIDAQTLVAMAKLPRPFAIDAAKPFEPGLPTAKALTSLSSLEMAFEVPRADVLSYLALPHDADCADGAKCAALSALTGWPADQICEVAPYVGTGSEVYDTLGGIDRLRSAFELSAKLGLDAFFIANLLALEDLEAGPAESWGRFHEIAAAVMAAASAKHVADWDTRNGQAVAELNERKRDALEPLVQWKLWQHDSGVVSRRRVYEFLLIDVEMSGCMMTSYVAEGINAVQLYLQRCRLNLEPGVDRLLVPAVWWEWLLSYRVWEANRKIFLYPENYLIPSLRRSKTRLFRDLEDSLLQSDASPQAVDAAFRSYLDGFTALSTLAYVDAYQCDVSQADGESTDTLFLFARTKAAPYTYYLNGQAAGASWGEWKQIPISIASEHITAVYAFSRLLIFWVELTELSSFQIATKDAATFSANQAMFTAAVRYSFYDVAGTWAAPQTLYQDQVAYVAPSQPPFTESSGYELFDVHSLYWHKVNAVRVPAGNVRVAAGEAAPSEKIAIFYGPFLENNTAGIPFDSIPSRPKPAEAFTNAAKYAFDLNNYERVLDTNQAVREPVRGPLPLVGSRAINEELNLDSLVRDNELLLLQENRAAGIPPTIGPVLDVALASLTVAPTRNVLRENYYGDYTSKISRSIQPARTTDASFILEAITAAGAEQVLSDLVTNRIVDADTHKVSARFTLNSNLGFLFGGASPATKASLTFVVQHVLLQLRAQDAPATASAFVADALGPDDSALVYDVLVSHAIIDDAGYVTALLTSSTDLSFLFSAAPPGQKALLIARVRRRLFEHMGDPTLLSIVAIGNASTIMVKNQPNRFCFNNGDEAFLVAPQGRRLPEISAHAKVSEIPSRPKVFEDSFITQDINEVASRSVYEDLQIHQVIGSGADEGLLTAYFSARTDLSFLFGGAPATRRAQLIAEVRAILLGLTTLTRLEYYYEDDTVIVDGGSFRAIGLDAARAAPVLEGLARLGIVGRDGILSPSFGDETDLSSLPADGADPALRTVLSAAVRKTLRANCEATRATNAHDLTFEFMRISTGAVSRLSQRLFAGGVDSLLSLATQDIPVVPQLPFSRYGPNPANVIAPRQFDGSQVDFSGTYGLYYWELFFFSPALIAAKLTADRRFAEAQSWYQYIFNPTIRTAPLAASSLETPDISVSLARQAYGQLREHGIITAADRVDSAFGESTPLGFLWPDVPLGPTKDRMIREVRNVLLNAQLSAPSSEFWRFRPFRHHTLQSLREILTDPAQIAVYNNDPFDPFAVAALRIGSFEKAIVMSYVDNLIAWGDATYAQYTPEALSSAMMLYVYAASLLGERPADVGTCPSQPTTTFEKIRARYRDRPGGIPQFLIDMEHFLPPQQSAGVAGFGTPVNELDSYFCVPENPQMLTYWDRVEDRLYKIRNCLDLEGKALKLPLFAPPIDPLELVRAAAAGRSSLSVSEQQRPFIPPYRFTSSLLHARTLTSTVSQLGASLLAALSARDLEAQARLRASQDLAILNLTTQIKTKQREQAEFALRGLQQSADAIDARRAYYAGLADEYLSEAEADNLAYSAVAATLRAVSTGLTVASSIAYATPQAGAPTALTYGGFQLGNSLAKAAGATEIGAQVADFAAQTSLTIAGHQRRAADWQFQAEQAVADAAQAQALIEGARAQLSMAERELQIHLLSVQHARQLEALLSTKFDSKELYVWVVGRISSLYFQAYKLALDSALAAQSAYRFELDLEDSFINFDYWDSLHGGLYAGEGLQVALDQMERAFMQNNTRRLEIKKTISLAALAPAELQRLKDSGECTIVLPEALYDLDYPGHYCRQLKSVELALATGDDYRELHATLTQVRNDIVLKPSLQAVKYLITRQGDAPSDIRTNWQAQQQIAFFSNQNPIATLEPYIFYSDDRYLPFEGTGAVSEWTFSLPKDTNHFDFSEISDLTVTVGYTALFGGKKFQDDVKKLVGGLWFEGATYVSLRESDPTAWEAFAGGREDPDRQVLDFELPGSALPANFSSVQLTAVDVIATAPGGPLPPSSQFIDLTIPGDELSASCTGPWQLTVRLDKMRDDPRLSALLDADGFADTAIFADLALALEYRARAFDRDR